MNKGRQVTIKMFMKLISCFIVLLLVGLQPVSAFADSGTNDSATISAASDTTSSNNASQSQGPDTTDAGINGNNLPVDSSNDAIQPTATNPVSTTDSSESPTSNPVNDDAPIANSDTTIDSNQSTTLTNNIGSAAQTGDANVSGNSTAGNATTGNSLASANILNLLGDTSNISGSNLDTFVTNITGDSNSDLLIDPTVLGQTISDPITNNLIFNSEDSGVINNNLDLDAESGNASVQNNGSAGNALSGNAIANANVINVINSDLESQQSFFGIINIYGDLSANISVPSQLFTSILSPSQSSSSSYSSNPSQNNSVNNTTFNDSINNQVSTSANSGNALVSNNNAGGNATTGSANNNINEINLINDQIFGNNAFLIFVNNLGSWNGTLLDSPAGTTSAILGNLEPQSDTNQYSSSALSNNNTNVIDNEQINNTILANASSGNATVQNNDNAGSATSGNADVNVSLLNIINSNLSVSGWFGVLFINVFGTWNGSLNVAQPPAVTTILNGNDGSTSSSSSPNQSGIPTSNANTHINGDGSFLDSSSGPQNSNSSDHVLGLSTTDGSGVSPLGLSNSSGFSAALRNILTSLIGLIIGICIIVSSKRAMSRSRA